MVIWLRSSNGREKEIEDNGSRSDHPLCVGVVLIKMNRLHFIEGELWNVLTNCLTQERKLISQLLLEIFAELKTEWQVQYMF